MSEWATADICPHGISSSICEWCGYKSTSEIRLQIIDKLEYRIARLRDALEFYATPDFACSAGLEPNEPPGDSAHELVEFGTMARQALEADKDPAPGGSQERD